MYAHFNQTECVTTTIYYHLCRITIYRQAIWSECRSLKLVTENTVSMGLSFMRTPLDRDDLQIFVMIESSKRMQVNCIRING